MSKIYFVTGIDTNIGKTIATGLIAKALAKAGQSVITQKLVQTGCVGISEDIEMHRKIQGIPLTTLDKKKITCPYVFTYPCSPHMAAERDKKKINCQKITNATYRLTEKYDFVLLEGAGGLMVPLYKKLLTIDYIRECRYPIILITNGRLGSINHTLLTLAACRLYQLQVAAIYFNQYPSEDEEIMAESYKYLKERLPEIPVLLLPDISKEETLPEIDVLI